MQFFNSGVEIDHPVVQLRGVDFDITGGIKKRPTLFRWVVLLERETGFEPAVFSLARRRCTTQLLPRVCRAWPGTLSAEAQDRTADTAIFSRVLYQLSYLGGSDDYST